MVALIFYKNLSLDLDFHISNISQGIIRFLTRNFLN